MFTRRQFILLSFIIFLVIVVVLLLNTVQHPQETRSRAVQSTTISFLPISTPSTPLIKNIGDEVPLNIQISPGQNVVSLVSMEIDYDPTVLSLDTSNSFTPVSYTVDGQPITMSIIDGPLTPSPGKLQVTLSMGSTYANAITQPTTVATVNFHVVGPSSGTSPVTFNSSTSKVYSIASTDQASENVLSTTQPAYVLVNTPPTSTPIPQATSTPTPTPTITLTPTPTPTSIPTPTPNAANVTLNFHVLLDGIGSAGDNSSPLSTLSNKSPDTKTHTLQVQLLNGQQQVFTQQSIAVNYDSTSGAFLGTASFTNIPNGSYIVLVATNGYLHKKIPGFLTVTAPAGQVVNYTVELTTGDVNDDNQLDLLDYNMILNALTTQDLTEDINDDGIVDIHDINLFLRELSVQFGD